MLAAANIESATQDVAERGKGGRRGGGACARGRAAGGKADAPDRILLGAAEILCTPVT